jgi:hypothetical protein
MDVMTVSPVGTWSHATNSMTQMELAVSDAAVASIECDVMCCAKDQPILSHPPSRNSDITVASCVNLITRVCPDGKRSILKNIKFDFKEIQAVQPTLDILARANLSNPYGKTVFLNADILPGPGRRDVEMVDAHAFLRKCIDFSQLFEVCCILYPAAFGIVCSRYNQRIVLFDTMQRENMHFALSLGYKCNWESDEGYLQGDICAMANLVSQYNLDKSKIGNTVFDFPPHL